MPEFSLRTTPPDYLTSVALGNVPDATIVLVQGANFDVDTGGSEDLCPGGGTYAFLSAPSALGVVSSSASDSGAGTGARTVLVNGLDAKYRAVSETVTLNGTTPVVLSHTYLRVNMTRVVSVGSEGENVGVISVLSPAAQNLAEIPARYGRSQCGVYTIPANFTGWLVDGFFTQAAASASARACAWQVRTRNYRQSWLSRAVVTTSPSMPTVALQPRALGPIGPGGDLVIRLMTADGNDQQVFGTMSLLLVAAPTPLVV